LPFPPREPPDGRPAPRSRLPQLVASGPTLGTPTRRLLRAIRNSPPVAGLKRLARLPKLAAIRRRDRRATCRDYLAICAIFKDEAPYLEEWLTFHAGVGVDHFHLYDNGSSDAFHDVLAPWIERGMVTLTSWPERGSQLKAYEHGLAGAADTARWVALIDVDEFLFSPRESELPRVLAGYEDRPGVFVYQHAFGSSGHLTHPAGPVIESYLMRQEPEEVCSGKSIVNPRLVRHADIHLSRTWFAPILDEKGKPPASYAYPYTNPPSWDVLRLNHYWSRSIAELEAKVARGRAAVDLPRDLERHLAREKWLNDVEDRTILPLWERIKARGTALPAASRSRSPEWERPSAS